MPFSPLRDSGPLAQNGSTAPGIIPRSARDNRALRRGDDINVAMQK
jgi:hypothetical protein